MKGFKRALSVFLVAILLLSGYVISPATALAAGKSTGIVANMTPESAEETAVSTSEPSGTETEPLGSESTPEPQEGVAEQTPEPSEQVPEQPEENGGEAIEISPLPDASITPEGELPAEEELIDTRVSLFSGTKQELDVMTMAEFEELLALQPELTAEDLEAYIIRNENADGSGTVELYLSPVRYKTSGGRWRMIDPEIAVGSKNGRQTLTSAKSPVRIDFQTSITENRLATLSRDGRSISLAPVPQSGLLSQNTFEMRYLADESSIFSMSGDAEASRSTYNSLRYRNAYGNGVDLVLTPTGSGMKEDVIFPSIPSQTSFSFLLTLDGLVPMLREDGNAYLVDSRTAEIVAAIPAPVMYDSSDIDCNFSYDIGVKLERLEDGSYLYTLTPNREWLESSDRVYPVSLDPTVTYSGASYIADTHVTDQYSGTRNYHTETGLKMGCMSNGDILRVYFDFTALISAIGANKQITGATLTCYEEYAGNSAPSVRLHQVTSNFSISTVTWNTQPSFESTHFSSTVVKNIGSYSWDMTAKGQQG